MNQEIQIEVKAEPASPPPEADMIPPKTICACNTRLYNPIGLYDLESQYIIFVDPEPEPERNELEIPRPIPIPPSLPPSQPPGQSHIVRCIECCSYCICPCCCLYVDPCMDLYEKCSIHIKRNLCCIVTVALLIGLTANGAIFNHIYK